MAVVITNEANTDFSWLSNHWGTEIRRIFFIYNVPDSAIRGGHRHRTCRMALVCQSGYVDIYVQTPETDQHFRLDSPTQMLLVDPRDWRLMHNFSEAAKLLVFADQYFCDTVYIDTPYRIPEIALLRNAIITPSTTGLYEASFPKNEVDLFKHQS